MNQTTFRKTLYSFYKITDKELIRVSGYGIDIYRTSDNEYAYNLFKEEALRDGYGCEYIDRSDFLKAFNKQWLKLAGTLSDLKHQAA